MACGFCGQVRGAIRGIVTAWRPAAPGGATRTKLTAGTPIYTGTKEPPTAPGERVLRRGIIVRAPERGRR
jgi:hypothetical protein